MLINRDILSCSQDGAYQAVLPGKKSDHRLEDHLRGSGGLICECPGSIGWMKQKRSPPSDPSPDELPPGPRASPDRSPDSDDTDAGFDDSQLAASQVSPSPPPLSPDCSSDSDDSDAGIKDSQLPASQGSPSPPPPPPPPSLVIPSALTPPPSPPSSQGQESSEDEIDVWVSSVFINAIKSAVFHLLNLTLHKYQRDNCFGCRIYHPSQKQHQCKDVLEDDFYQVNFYRLMEKLYTPRFIPSIQRLLIMHASKRKTAKSKPWQRLCYMN